MSGWALWLVFAACAPPEEVDTGAIACPSITAPPEVRLEGARIGEPLTAEVTLANGCGEGDALEITAALYADPGLSLDAPAATIAAGAEGALIVRYTADGYGARTGTLVLGTNDPARPEVAVAVIAAAAPDQDGDGFDAVEAGGDDCDDGDIFATPGGAEVEDSVDNDCDGLVDEDTLERGDVRIVEVMIDPAVTQDADGEWIEVVNTSGIDVDLIGWELGDSAGAVVTIDASVVLPPGVPMVLAARDDANNGGVSPAWVWGPGALTLAQPIGRVTLGAAGLEIARVAWDDGQGVDPGASWALDAMSSRADRAENMAFWCPQTTRFGLGDRGTPGAENELCRTVDHDGDGESAFDGDCDDADPTVNQRATEVPNGKDDDCDALVDEAA